MVEVGLRAEGRVDQFEPRIGRRFNGAKHLDGFGRDLRTDTVAFKYCDNECLRHAYSLTSHTGGRPKTSARLKPLIRCASV